MKWVNSVVAVITLLLLTQACFSASSKGLLEQRINWLEIKHKDLTQSIAKKVVISAENIHQAKQYLDLLQMDLRTYQLNLNLARTERLTLNQQLQQVNAQFSSVQVNLSYETLKPKVVYLTEMIKLRDKQIYLIEENRNLNAKLALQYEEAIKEYQLDKLHQQRMDKIKILQKEIQLLRQKNTEILSGEIEKEADSKDSSIDLRILKDLALSLNALEVEILQLTIKLNYNDYLRIRSDTLKTLNTLIERLSYMKQRSSSTIDLLQSILSEDAKQLTYWEKLKNLNLVRLFKAQSNRTKQLLSKINKISETINKHLADYEQERQTLLSSRKSFFKDSIGHGHEFFKELIELPKIVGLYIQGLYSRVKDFATTLLTWQKVVAGLVCGIVIFLWYEGRRLLSNFIESSKSSSGEKNLYVILAILLSKNWGAIWLLTLLCTLFSFSGIQASAFHLILVVFCVWFTFKTVIVITRLALLETFNNISGLDVHLYHRLKATFIIGAIITYGTVISHYLAVDYLVRAFFDRLFMLFLFMVSIVLLKGHKVLMLLLQSYLKPKKFYTKRALDLSTLLVPSVLLVNGTLGILGYVQLAWDMSYYQVVIVTAVISYVVLRGLLLDGLEVISESMIAKLSNGWLWTEAFLKPLHTILRYMVILLLVFVVFRVYGWDSDSSVNNLLYEIWHFNLFNFSRAKITTESLIEFLIMFVALLWIAKWSREFCYRWVFHQVQDQGLRNSLAVFSQYAFIGIGAVVTLTILGLDISGISMILGGLAVGMGFGLRDFANNIIGGMMLLIERPVKEGDLISVDNIEGRVTHIGIRSMRVKSWDNYEVAIPNADTFSKPFTNWTHRDSVVRTVVPIKVNRHDSPSKVQQLILDVLKIIPEVLSEPKPQVFLKHIDDALIEFEIRYYINVDIHSRIEIRSNVLFAIMAQFKAAGIKAPIPPIQIEQIAKP